MDAKRRQWIPTDLNKPHHTPADNINNRDNRDISNSRDSMDSGDSSDSSDAGIRL